MIDKTTGCGMMFILGITFLWGAIAATAFWIVANIIVGRMGP